MTMFIDDDSGPGLNSRFVAPTGGVGRVILGSFSLSSEGACGFSLEPAAGPLALAFNLSERQPDEAAPRREDGAMTPQMERYVARLRESKTTLEALEPDEREQRVIELQKEFLSDEDRRPLILPAPQAAPDFVRLQRIYLERYKEMERELDGSPTRTVSRG